MTTPSPPPSRRCPTWRCRCPWGWRTTPPGGTRRGVLTGASPSSSRPISIRVRKDFFVIFLFCLYVLFFFAIYMYLIYIAIYIDIYFFIFFLSFFECRFWIVLVWADYLLFINAMKGIRKRMGCFQINLNSFLYCFFCDTYILKEMSVTITMTNPKFTIVFFRVFISS